MVCSPKSAGNFSRMARWMASIPVPSLALMMMGGCPQLAFICSASSVVLGRTSALFRSNMTGIPRSFNR